jgi:drug/metabolite transporter (DMT)-like permease
LDPRVPIVWWLTCLLWSGTFAFIKLGLRELPPLTFAWVRLAIAAAVLVPYALSRGQWRSLSSRDTAHVMAAGVLLLAVNYALTFWGAQHVPSGLVAILQSGTPLLALLVGWLLGSEEVTPRKVLALACGVMGVAAIFGAEARVSADDALGGAAAIVGGSLCVATAYVWLKTHTPHVPRTTVTALQVVAGLVPLTAAGLVLEGPPRLAGLSSATWGALLYLAVFASVVAFWLNYWLLQRMDASAMLMLGVAEVPIAVALGAVIFGERMPAGTLVGGTLVLVGVVAVLGGNPLTRRRR